MSFKNAVLKNIEQAQGFYGTGRRIVAFGPYELQLHPGAKNFIITGYKGAIALCGNPPVAYVYVPGTVVKGTQPRGRKQGKDEPLALWVVSAIYSSSVIDGGHKCVVIWPLNSDGRIIKGAKPDCKRIEFKRSSSSNSNSAINGVAAPVVTGVLVNTAELTELKSLHLSSDPQVILEHHKADIDRHFEERGEPPSGGTTSSRSRSAPDRFQFTSTTRASGLKNTKKRMSVGSDGSETESDGVLVYTCDECCKELNDTGGGTTCIDCKSDFCTDCFEDSVHKDHKTERLEFIVPEACNCKRKRKKPKGRAGGRCNQCGGKIPLPSRPSTQQKKTPGAIKRGGGSGRKKAPKHPPRGNQTNKQLFTGRKEMVIEYLEEHHQITMLQLRHSHEQQEMWGKVRKL